jgi:hypothetical protein
MAQSSLNSWPSSWILSEKTQDEVLASMGEVRDLFRDVAQITLIVVLHDLFRVGSVYSEEALSCY